MRGWPISTDWLPHVKVAAKAAVFCVLSFDDVLLNIRPILPDQPGPFFPSFLPHLHSLFRFFRFFPSAHCTIVRIGFGERIEAIFSDIQPYIRVFSTELPEKLVPTRSSVPRHFVTLRCDHTASHSMSARVPAHPYALFR